MTKNTRKQRIQTPTRTGYARVGERIRRYTLDTKDKVLISGWVSTRDADYALAASLLSEKGAGK